MFDRRKTKELILASLVADSYCLGSHWIYDEKQLKSLKVDWENLNAPCAIWHKGKNAGEFTHYGDQINMLYEYATQNETFDLETYIPFWKKRMESYNGYMDGATKKTLENLNSGLTYPNCGSTSTDLSVVGRIAPLMLISKTKKEFLENVEKLVRITHNSQIAIDSAKFFAKVLLDVLEDVELIESIKERKDEVPSNIQKFINEGLTSKDEDTFDTIRKFGPACDISEGLKGVIHLLAKYSNFKEALIKNAQAGGDNSARAMIMAILFVARYGFKVVPSNLTFIKVHIDI